jgi:hypothetical protein
MKSTIGCGLAVSSLCLLLFVAPAQAEYKCDKQFLSRVDAKACAAAAEGADSLRRFVSRTQAIYHLQVADYARFEGDPLPSQVSRPQHASAQKPTQSVAAPSQ